MSLSLPLPGSELRAFFSVSDLADRSAFRPFPDVLRALRRHVAETAGVHSAQGIALRADGQLWLIRVGPRGGWSKLWNFGKL